MDTGQVAGVCQLPGQADGSIQAALEMADQPLGGRGGGGEGHEDSFVEGFGADARIPLATIALSAVSYLGQSVAGMPSATYAARALSWSPSTCTRSSRSRSLRKDNRRFPKWKSSAPNGSGRTDTCECSI